MNKNAVIIEPSQAATASVIWLHGLGASGHDFESIVSQLADSFTSYTRFIFPHAPQLPITINGGMVMPGWYDIIDIAPNAPQDDTGIRNSEQLICQYIEQEMQQGIKSQRIILAGFSQGGAIALQTGLRYPHSLAGIMVLSSYLPLNDTVESEKHLANINIPIFMAHGHYDPVISFNYAEISRIRLEKLTYKVEWHSYKMEHQVCPEEIRDIDKWLSIRLT
ncbi:MAG: alpha/beta fold hydrolase [Thiomargarita sp.]|nr:alpha/beta fold hydrolase [Thiomargarita sp.]